LLCDLCVLCGKIFLKFLANRKELLLKIAFLDRDGTIIEDYPDEEWRLIKEPVFLDKSISAIKEFILKGYDIIIITNQYVIGEGIITLEQYEKLTEKMNEIFKKNNIKILDIFYCPHSRKENCDCCKPKDGMIKQALKKYPVIDLNGSFLAGDSDYDIELGINLGVKTFGIKIKNINFKYIRVNDLSEIIKFI
jgi:D-glycero-D-manno-heptose 1,7-bisphosphate phosphatase